jgi:hypothetical protein
MKRIGVNEKSTADAAGAAASCLGCAWDSSS